MTGIAASRWGLPLFCHHPFQPLVVPREIGQQFLQAAVFFFQQTKPFGSVLRHPAVLRLPVVDGADRNAVEPRDLCQLLARLNLFKNAQNLLLGIPFSFHRASGLTILSQSEWTEKRGSRHMQYAESSLLHGTNLIQEPIELCSVL